MEFRAAFNVLGDLGGSEVGHVERRVEPRCDGAEVGKGGRHGDDLDCL